MQTKKRTAESGVMHHLLAEPYRYQFIQAVRAVVTESTLDDRGKMLGFWRKGEPPAIGNAELVHFALSDAGWSHEPPGASHSRVVPF